MSSSTLANALCRPWPKGEWLIANALGIHPAEIWPSRYYDPDSHQLLDRKRLMRPHSADKNSDKQNQQS